MTKIQWVQGSDGSAGETWNPIVGCSRISDGCKNCYAETMTKRLEAMGQAKYAGLLNAQGRFNGVTRFDKDALLKPLKRKKPTTYFVNSMSDLFHESIPDEWIDKVFAVMALCPQHTFQILTKRAERMERYADFGHLPNVWLGVSTENQEQADARIPHLLETPAAVLFVSAEPLLGEIDFSRYLRRDRKLDWIICGGESGAGARPCRVEWIRSVVRQCKSAGVPVFVKQLGSNPIEQRSLLSGDLCHFYSLELRDRKGGDMSEWDEDLRIREMPK